MWEGRQETGNWGWGWGSPGKSQGMGGFLSRERVKFLAGGQGGKNKGAPILCPGLQMTPLHPFPQLPGPPTSLGITLGMQSQAGASPSTPQAPNNRLFLLCLLRPASP